MDFIVYILKCSDGSLYTGWTTNIERRLKEHGGEAQKKGAKYTSGRRPVQLIYTEICTSKSDALCREIEIKKYSRTKKLELVKKSASK